MIRLATHRDLEQTKLITQACAEALQKLGIFQWNQNYPSRKKLKQDIDQNELYVLEERAEIRGMIVLSLTMSPIYRNINWLTPSHNNLYVHRLAVSPDFWKKGFGNFLMNFAEDFAQSNKCPSVRLDTFSQNRRNQNFYEARTYIKTGEVFYPEKSSFPFFCYELVLNQNLKRWMIQ